MMKMTSRLTSEPMLDPFSRTITIPLPLYIQLSGGSYGNNGLASQLDNYMIYVFKVKRCSRNRSHDWTVCPYAHRGEKAKRRDPRKISYHGIACPNWRRTGECPRGSKCEFSHGVFEYWLHPSRYRTRLCEAGEQCTRKVCFFAHSVQQLRAEMPQMCIGCEHVTAAAQRGMSGAGGGNMALLPQDPEEMMDEPVRCVMCIQAAARVGKEAMAAAAGPAAGLNLHQWLAATAGPFPGGSRPPRFTTVAAGHSAAANTSKRFAAVGMVVRGRQQQVRFEDQVYEPELDFEWVDDLVNYA